MQSFNRIRPLAIGRFARQPRQHRDIPGVLPLLRRTFATFTPAERRQMGERARAGGRVGGSADEDLDPTRVELVLPILRQILGISDALPTD